MSKSKRSLDGRLGEVYDTFQTVKQEMSLTGNGSDKACLASLIEAYRTAHEIDDQTVIRLMHCSVAEIEEINRGLSVEYAHIWNDLREGLLYVVRQRNHYLAADNQLHDAQTRKARQTGSYEHIVATMAQLMRANEQATHTFEQVYLSVGMVIKIAHAHKETVRQYFVEHRDEIDAHNVNVLGIMSEAHGKRHNLLRAKYLQAERAGTGEAFLARYGMRLVTRNGQQNHQKLATEESALG